MKGYQEKYEEWCNNQIFDEETKAELEKMKQKKRIVSIKT